MNRRKEERILEAVFEDGSLTDTLSPAETARMNEYREIRHRLQLLKEVPEDQMSKERLRDAILNRGLGQTEARRERHRFAGLIAPAASFAIAFVAIVVLRNGEPAPQGNFVEGNTAAIVDTTRSAPLTIQRQPVPQQPLVAKNSGQQATSSRVNRVATTRSKRTPLVENARDEDLMVSNVGVPGTSTITEPKATLAVEKLESVTLGASGESASGPIVLIEPAASVEEPARATETSTGANTLVGG